MDAFFASVEQLDDPMLHMKSHQMWNKGTNRQNSVKKKNK